MISYKGQPQNQNDYRTIHHPSQFPITQHVYIYFFRSRWCRTRRQAHTRGEFTPLSDMCYQLTVLQAFLERKVSIVVLTRPGSTTASKLPAGTKSVAVDLKDIAAVAAVFKEYSVEVVVSTVGAPALDDQRGIADAAKQSGVKLFVPSEFGVPTIGETAVELAKKDEFAKYLTSIGLPSVRIFVRVPSLSPVLHILPLDYFRTVSSQSLFRGLQTSTLKRGNSRSEAVGRRRGALHRLEISQVSQSYLCPMRQC